MESDIKILFISAFETPFIRDDLTILEKSFEVRKQIGHGVSAILKIIIGAFSADLLFCWFASVYASIGVAIGKIFGTESIIVVGGVDVAKEKDLGYGIWLSPWRSVLVRYALRHADRVLVVDPSLRTDAINLAGYDGWNIQYIPTGYDSFFWKSVGDKEPVVLTVAVANDVSRFKIKGIDILIEAARRLPQTTFVVIGVNLDLALRLRPPLNIHFHSLMSRVELLPFYRQAKIYCQPSRREGLPNTLCEAMLCECIPIATDVGGNRTAVGDAGLLIPSGDVNALCSAIGEAMRFPAGLGAKARARVVSLFPREKREMELNRIIMELLA